MKLPGPERGGTAAPSARESWLRWTWSEIVLVAGGAAVLAVAMTYPLAARMAHVGRIDSHDGQFSIWNVAWVARTLAVDPLHVYDANIFYPHRWTLAYSENNLGAGILAIPAYWATHNPYFALNFVVLLSLALSAVTMYALVRYLTGDRGAAAVSAICFAFCPYVFAQTTSIQLMMIAGFPLAMLAFHRAADRPTPGRGAALGAAMAAEAVCCGYYGVFLIFVVGFSILVIAATRRYWRERRYWICLAVATGVAIAIVLPLFVPYLQLERLSGFGRPLDEARLYSADWRGYLASSAWSHIWILRLLGHWQGAAFPGFVAIGCGLAGAWLAWRSPNREPLLLYGGLALFGVWASLGPDAGLYAALYRLVPLMSWLRAPARFAIVPELSVCVFAGVAVARMSTAVSRPTMVAVVIATAAAVELRTPLPFVDVPRPQAVYRVLRKLPRGGVIELPLAYQPQRFISATSYMLASTSHWMPLVNGFSDYIPPDYVRDAYRMGTFPSRDAFDALAPRHVRYAVIHLDAFDRPSRDRLVAWLAAAGADLRLLYADEDTRLYKIVRYP